MKRAADPCRRLPSALARRERPRSKRAGDEEGDRARGRGIIPARMTPGIMPPKMGVAEGDHLIRDGSSLADLVHVDVAVGGAREERVAVRIAGDGDGHEALHLGGWRR